MLRKLLLVGTLQGWGLWALWQANELKLWPATDSISLHALLYLALSVPLAIYLSADLSSLSRTRRIQLLAFIAVLFPLLGAYSGWANDFIATTSFDTQRFRPGDLLAASVLGFVLIPLLAHFNPTTRSWTYHDLFASAWRNAMLCLSAGALTGLFWVVLVAGSGLLDLIGLSFMHQLIEQAVFIIPVTSIAFSTAFALGLARSEMVITLRRFQLSMLAWLLPLLMLFIVVWVAALPFTGVDALFKTHDAAFIMLWCAALCINFVNAAYQDGLTPPAYGRLLSRSLAWAWLGLLVVVSVAWWAMGLRIAQYGWSEDRVWGVFVALMASIYVLGYALSAWRAQPWLASISTTNIIAAIVLCGGLLALLSPLADARRIAVNSQMQRLSAQTVTLEKFDFDYLRWEAGRYGHEALAQLATGIAHPEQTAIAAKAKLFIAKTQRWNSENETLSAAQLRSKLRVLPSKAVLDEKLISAMMAAEKQHWLLRRCFELNSECAVWLLDVNNDQRLDAVLFAREASRAEAGVIVMQNFGDNYRLNGEFPASNVCYEDSLAQIAAGNFKLVKPEFNDIEIAGQRFQLRTYRPTTNSYCGKNNAHKSN
ncbi:MAG: DUF4153 domain-containing protein [Sideroxydans sp.]|nr:DUF4153 domain-containing protein [Sideroxydans sp.]